MENQFIVIAAKKHAKIFIPKESNPYGFGRYKGETYKGEILGVSDGHIYLSESNKRLTIKIIYYNDGTNEYSTESKSVWLIPCELVAFLNKKSNLNFENIVQYLKDKGSKN